VSKKGMNMRALKILTGMAVLLTALHFAHAIHHFVSQFPNLGPGVWLAVVAAVLIDLLAFVGGGLLFRSGG
jgi:alcohol dehydrogenase class IV